MMKSIGKRFSFFSLFVFIVLYTLLCFSALPVSPDVYSQSTTKEALFNEAGKKIDLKVQPPTDPNQDKMDVLHCRLYIKLNMSAANITSASLTLTAESLDSSLNTCVLDLNDNGGSMVVSYVDSGDGTPPLSYSHDGAQNRVFITLPSSVPAGNTFTVRLFYSGTPASGAYYRTTHSGAPLVFTNSQPYDARRWWPCKDIPGDKFTAEMLINCPDASYNGYPLFPVSNGKLLSIVNNGDGTKTFHWYSSYLIASQYVSIACSNYRPAEGVYTALDSVTTMSVAHYVYPESYASESQELPRTIEVIEFFADKFGEYPFLSEKYWTATWAQSGGMEHQTCTSMPDDNLNNPPYHRRNIHELSHMWFGVALAIAHFDHLWISEGWATYCEPLFYEHLYGTTAYHDYINAWSTSDAYPLVSTSADAFSGNIVYRKGAWVLHMLRHIIGDTAFFTGAKNYCEDTNLRYNTAWSSDLQAHFEATYGSSLSWFFDAWLYQANRPNYQWWWRPRTPGTDTYIEIGIQQVQSGGYYTMPIDFRAELQGGGHVDLHY
jgi:aminopeptidase N